MDGTRIPEALLGAIRDKGHVVLMTHVRPDGDAVGSLLATADLLEQMGKRVFAYLEEPLSHLFDFFPDGNRVNCDIGQLRRFIREAGTDLCAIALDCGEADRIGEEKGVLLSIHPFLVVDHHLSHANFGDYRWIEPDRSSTGEMVYEISEALGQRLSYNCAFALYIAIATDTGSFRYECTGSRTFAIAARLLEYGVRPEYAARCLFDNFSPARLDLMQMVLQTVDLREDGSIVFIHVSQDMFDRSGAPVQDAEGFIEYPRAIRSVKVAVFIKETRGGLISVSLRAKGECNVAEVAKRFGGGGHRNAAGCRFPGETIESVREKLLGALRQSLAEISLGGG